MNFIDDLDAPSSRYKIQNKHDLLEPLKGEVVCNDFLIKDLVKFYHLISERGPDG